MVFLLKVMRVKTGPDFIIGRSLSVSGEDEVVVFAIMNNVSDVSFFVPLSSR